MGVRKIHPSQSAAGPSGSNHRTPTNAVDIWREVVKSRWNEEARFLNLEVCIKYSLRVWLNTMILPENGGRRDPQEAQPHTAWLAK